MALGTPTQLGAAGATGNTAVTNSFTPTANAKLFVLTSARSSSDITAFTITDSTGALTWTTIAERYENVSGVRVGIKAAVATLIFTPGSMTVQSVNNSAGGQTCVSVFQVTGASASITNFITGFDAATGDPAIALPVAPTDIAIACFGGCGGGNIAPPTGFTELSDVLVTSFDQEVSYDNTSPPQNYSYTTSFTLPSLAIGFEIKELAFGVPLLLGTHGTGIGTGANATTGLFLPIANARLFAAFSGRRGTGTSGAVTSPTISDTAGLTWTSVLNQEVTGTAPAARLAVFTAVAPASPVSMSVTTNSTNTETSSTVVCQMIDVGSDLTNRDSDTSTTGDPACVIGATPTGSVVAWATISNFTTEIPTPSGFTEIVDFVDGVASSNPLATWLGYDNTAPGTGVTWTTTGTTSVGIAVDVKAPALTGGARVDIMGWIG